MSDGRRTNSGPSLIERLRAWFQYDPSDLVRAGAFQKDTAEAADALEAAKLLGPARMVLDRCAEGMPGCREEAAQMGQRIVDIIGHPVTDEPPHALVVVDAARRLIELVEQSEADGAAITQAHLDLKAALARTMS